MRSIHGQKKVDPAHPEATYYEVKLQDIRSISIPVKTE